MVLAPENAIPVVLLVLPRLPPVITPHAHAPLDDMPPLAQDGPSSLVSPPHLFLVAPWQTIQEAVLSSLLYLRHIPAPFRPAARSFLMVEGRGSLLGRRALLGRRTLFGRRALLGRRAALGAIRPSLALAIAVAPVVLLVQTSRGYRVSTLVISVL